MGGHKEQKTAIEIQKLDEKETCLYSVCERECEGCKHNSTKNLWQEILGNKPSTSQF